MLPTESIGLTVQKKKSKIDFQDGRHLGFPIRMILAIFISTSHPDASYEFSNQLALWFRPSWISDPNNLSSFRSTSQMAIQFRRRSEK